MYTEEVLRIYPLIPLILQRLLTPLLTGNIHVLDRNTMRFEKTDASSLWSVCKSSDTNFQSTICLIWCKIHCEHSPWRTWPWLLLTLGTLNSSSFTLARSGQLGCQCWYWESKIYWLWLSLLPLPSLLEDSSSTRSHNVCTQYWIL